MPYIPNTCCYCGKLADSKEHPWGKWALDLMPVRFPRTLHTLIKHNAAANYKPEISRGKFSGKNDPHKGHIKCVCRDCNNTWMSKIQNDAKPVLTRLHGNYTWSLTHEEVIAVQAWITNFVMIWEIGDPSTIAITQQEREDFRISAQAGRPTPPERLAIFLGINECKNWTGKILHRGITLVPGIISPEKSPPPAHMQSTTFTFGKLFIYCISHRTDISFDIETFAHFAGLGILWPATGKPQEQFIMVDDARADAISECIFKISNAPLKMLTFAFDQRIACFPPYDWAKSPTPWAGRALKFDPSKPHIFQRADT